jgi:hypothetical protein
VAQKELRGYFQPGLPAGQIQMWQCSQSTCKQTEELQDDYPILFQFSDKQISSGEKHL